MSVLLSEVVEFGHKLIMGGLSKLIFRLFSQVHVKVDTLARFMSLFYWMPITMKPVSRNVCNTKRFSVIQFVMVLIFERILIITHIFY